MSKRSIKPKTYEVSKTIKLTKIQARSLSILKSHGVNVQDFIREAIKTKIENEWQEIKIKNKTTLTPF